MRWVLGVALLTLVATASAATSARNATVTITDRGVVPRTARMEPGGRVTFRNRGRRPHAVVSETNAWRAFSLRPGGRRSVRLRRAGRYCYRVDGRRRAVVRVGSGGPAFCVGGGGGGGSGPRTVVHRYDVSITGQLHYTGQVLSDTGHVDRSGPAGFITGANGPTGPGFFAWAQLTLESGRAMLEAKQAEWRARCNDWAPPTLLTADEFAGPDGTTMQPFIALLAAHFDRRGGEPRRNPVPALIAGRGFSLQSGLNITERPSCTGTCSGTERAEERYTIRFTPRR